MAPQSQIHDFHPAISESGLYWVVPIPPGGLTYSPDHRVATIQMRDVPVIDQPRWPALDATGAPATMDFKLVFTAGDVPLMFDHPLQHFRFDGHKATAQLEAQVRVPSTGFEWKSDPLETSRCDFAILGTEVNSLFYDSPAGKPPEATQPARK